MQQGDNLPAAPNDDNSERDELSSRSETSEAEDASGGAASGASLEAEAGIPTEGSAIEALGSSPGELEAAAEPSAATPGEGSAAADVLSPEAAAAGLRAADVPVAQTAGLPPSPAIEDDVLDFYELSDDDSEATPGEGSAAAAAAGPPPINVDGQEPA